MATLNPFFDDDSASDDGDDDDDNKEAGEVNDSDQTAGLLLPDPVKVTVKDSNSKDDSHPAPVEESQEDLLELEVNQTEFAEFRDNNKDEDEDVEIICEGSGRQVKKQSITSSSETKQPINAITAPSVLAKLVQLNKTSSYITKGKVRSGVLEVLEGEHSGKKAAFQAGCSYVWGYHLTSANLMYHLRSGDKFHVTVTIKEGVEDVEDMEIPLLVKKAWLGVKSETPVLVSENLEFSAWLMERGLSEETFLQWISDKLPPKPYFPLKTELFEAKVIMLIRETPKGDGALVRIVKEGDMRDSLAVFERDDFYVCGVHVGEADLRFLIKPGDTVQVQVKELTEREKKNKCRKYPKLEEFEFNHTCLLAYTGHHRPRGPQLKPAESQELKTFLEQKGMSIEEFEQMRNIVNNDNNENSEENIQPPGTDQVSSSSASLPTPAPSVFTTPGSFSTPQPPVSNSNPMNWLVNPTPPSLAPPGTTPSLAPPGTSSSLAPPGTSPLLTPPGTSPSLAPPGVFTTPALSQPQKSPENSSDADMMKISKCNSLVAKAIMMKSKQQKLGDLLVDESDYEMAYFMADMFTDALVSSLQNKPRNKFFDKMGSGAGAILSSMTRQLQMTAPSTQVMRAQTSADIIQAATNVAINTHKPASQAMMEAQQKTLAAFQVNSCNSVIL